MHQLTDKKNKIIIYLFFLFILSTTIGKFEDNQRNYSSNINKINIEGLSNSYNSKIYNELNNLFYKNILLVGKEEIQKVISSHNIVEEYYIKKIYPSTIKIKIKPTKFIARLSGSSKLVGANGKLIDDKRNNKILPYIFGDFDTKAFLKLKKKVERSKFTFIKFKMLYFFPSNRWDILTYDNILIKLPQEDISKSLNLAHKIISSTDFNNKKLIDLRIKNHMIIK